jgi:cellulose synthase/poly-beta-1,6-N-acetylglucosamine synthase-like glycosyltransferase
VAAKGKVMSSLSGTTLSSFAARSAICAIMPVYNGAALIRQSLLPLLAMQGCGEIAELIVVDDGSSDETVEVASSLGARVISSGGRLGPGGARNIAAQLATSDLLWFVDADVVVHSDAARVLAGAFTDSGAAAVFGTYDNHPSAVNFFSQYKNLVHHFYHSRQAGDAETFWAGCGAIRKDIFLELDGFDLARYPVPSIEDIELGCRLRRRGLRIHRTPKLQATHLKVWRLGNLLYTDIFCRALPWSRLIHTQDALVNTLNIGTAERLYAVLAACVFASILMAASGLVPWWSPLAVLFVAGAANWRLLEVFHRARGAAFAVCGIMFHQVYYLYSSVAFVWTWLEQRWLNIRRSYTIHTR